MFMNMLMKNRGNSAVECALGNGAKEHATKFTEPTLEAKLAALKEHFERVEKEARQFIEDEYPRLESQISMLKRALHREKENKHDHYEHLSPQQIKGYEQRITDLEATQNEQKPKLRSMKASRDNAHRSLRHLNDLNAKVNFAKGLKLDADRSRGNARKAVQIADNLEQSWKMAIDGLRNQANELMDRENIQR